VGGPLGVERDDDSAVFRYQNRDPLTKKRASLLIKHRADGLGPVSVSGVGAGPVRR
jgi:hypothetical protein